MTGLRTIATAVAVVGAVLAASEPAGASGIESTFAGGGSRVGFTTEMQSCLAENGYVPSGQTREEDDRRCSGDGPGCTGQRDWYHSPHRWYCTPCAMRYGYVGLSQVQGSWE